MVNRLRSEQGTRPYWRNEGEIGLGNRAPVTILVALAVCAALLFHLGAAIWAQTNRDFDNAGTPFAVDQLSTPPNNPPREVPSGTTGKFLRLAGAPTPNSNTVTFDRTDAGVFPLIVADFDFRITPTIGRADGLGFALLQTGPSGYGDTGSWRPGPGHSGADCVGGVIEEPNFANSLGIGFDVYKSPAEIDNNHVSVHYNCAKLLERSVSPINLASGQWTHARIVFRQTVALSDVTVVLTPRGGHPVTVIDAFQIPNVTPYEGRALWGARAGGEAADFDVDNLRVNFVNPASSVFSFANTYYAATESDSGVLITAARVGNATGGAQVRYSTSDGTALAGTDYVATSGTLIWGPGDSSPKSILVPVINDVTDVGEERSFFVSLSSPSSGDVLGGPSTATVAILDGATVQDFSSASSGTPYSTRQCVMLGTPPVVMPDGPTGSFLRLVSGNSTNHNTIAFNRTRMGIAPLIVADFDFRITPPAPTQLGRADGLGFALLNTADSVFGYTGSACPPAVAEEPNFANSLGVGFDIYQSIENGQTELNDNHVSLHFNSVKLMEFDATPGADLATGQWVHARIIFRQPASGSNVTVMLGPRGAELVKVVDSFPIPDAIPYEARALFAARAGSPNKADHDIDNIRVQFLDASAGILSLSSTYYSATEGEPSLLVTVNRTEGNDGLRQVTYATSNGSAVAGSDYTSVSGTLTWASGDSMPKSFVVPLLNDTADEGDESFFVSISDPAPGAGSSLALATIVDDERASQTGSWALPFNTQIVAVHMHLLPDGTAMYWPGDSGEGLGLHPFEMPRIWNPATRVIESIVQPYNPFCSGHCNLFCSGHTFLADGRLFVTGGHESLPQPPPPAPPGPVRRGLTYAAIYNPVAKKWTGPPAIPEMNNGRWYPTNTTLANGNVLVLSGEISGPGPGDPPVPAALVNDIPQVWDVRLKNWTTLTGAQKQLPLYPWMFLAPDGRVFYAGAGQAAGFVNTTGIGSLNFPASLSRITDRFEGAAVMYGDGKVLVAGGSHTPINGAEFVQRNAEVIDLNSCNLSSMTSCWRTLPNDMAFGRRYATPVLLPDGTVLVTGGTTSPGFNNAAGAVLAPELWNPTTETWSTLAPMQVKRIYHSTAILLRDGRVLVAGGGQPAPADYHNNFDAQVFSPPYLFKGPRPVVMSAPTRVTYGEVFSVATSDASITAVNWIRLPSVTHTFNQNQRINRLTFVQTSGGLNVTAPMNPNLAPPGHYMLFIIGTNGVPSVASIVELGTAFTDDPLVVGSTLIRAVHITELRDRIDALRVGKGLETFAWTDPTLTVGLTTIRARHIIDLRTALTQAYAARSLSAPTYTDITPDVTSVKALHITELRAAVKAIE